MTNSRTTMALVLGAAALLAAPAWGEDEKLVRREGKWVKLAKPAKGTPAGEAAIVRQRVDKRKFRSAVRNAKKFLKRYPAHRLREEVLSLAGDAEMARGRYWQAYQWYEKQISEFPNGDRLERALDKEMAIARAFLAGKKRIAMKVLRLSAISEGIEILQRIAEHVPGTERAELALLAVGDHHFAKGEWKAAAESYDGYLQLFPKSRRAAHARLRAAEATRRSYRGSTWDETPLIEAEQRYKAFAARHPAAARKIGVPKVLKEIRSARAANRYQVGQFYLRTGKRKSAAYYFTLVAREFADTEWAGRARVALAKIAPAGKAPAKAVKPAPPRRPTTAPAGKAPPRKEAKK